MADRSSKGVAVGACSAANCAALPGMGSHTAVTAVFGSERRAAAWICPMRPVPTIPTRTVCGAMSLPHAKDMLGGDQYAHAGAGDRAGSARNPRERRCTGAPADIAEVV